MVTAGKHKLDGISIRFALKNHLRTTILSTQISSTSSTAPPPLSRSNMGNRDRTDLLIMVNGDVYNGYIHSIEKSWRVIRHITRAFHT